MRFNIFRVIFAVVLTISIVTLITCSALNTNKKQTQIKQNLLSSCETAVKDDSRITVKITAMDQLKFFGGTFTEEELRNQVALLFGEKMCELSESPQNAEEFLMYLMGKNYRHCKRICVEKIFADLDLLKEENRGFSCQYNENLSQLNMRLIDFNDNLLENKTAGDILWYYFFFQKFENNNTEGFTVLKEYDGSSQSSIEIEER